MRFAWNYLNMTQRFVKVQMMGISGFLSEIGKNHDLDVTEHARTKSEDQSDSDLILQFERGQKSWTIDVSSVTEGSPRLMPSIMREALGDIIACRCLFNEQKGKRVKKFFVIFGQTKDISDLYLKEEFVSLYVPEDADDFIVVTMYERTALDKIIRSINEESLVSRCFSFKDLFVPLSLLSLDGMEYVLVRDEDLIQTKFFLLVSEDTDLLPHLNSLEANKQKIKEVKSRLAVLKITDPACRWNGMNLDDVVYRKQMNSNFGLVMRIVKKF